MLSAEVKARDLIHQTGAEARLRRSIAVEALTLASLAVPLAKVRIVPSSGRAAVVLAPPAAAVSSAKVRGALSTLRATALPAPPAAAVPFAKLRSAPSTLLATALLAWS